MTNEGVCVEHETFSGKIQEISLLQASDSVIIKTMADDMKRTRIILEGNGNPGLPEQVRAVTKSVDDHLEAEELREGNNLRFRTSILLWAVKMAVPVLAAALAGGAGMHFLQGGQ